MYRRRCVRCSQMAPKSRRFLFVPVVATMAMMAMLMVNALAQGQANAPTTATPYEQVVRDLQALKRDPYNRALRMKIVQEVDGLDPKPKVPDDALEHQGAAEAAFKNATSRQDYAHAGDEFWNAATAAPWVASYYYNSAVAYEKAEAPDVAVEKFEYYLTLSPNAPDAVDVRKRIGALKAAADVELRNISVHDFQRHVEGKTFVRMTCASSQQAWFRGDRTCTWDEAFHGKNRWFSAPADMFVWRFKQSGQYLEGELVTRGKQDDQPVVIASVGSQPPYQLKFYYPVKVFLEATVPFAYWSWDDKKLDLVVSADKGAEGAKGSAGKWHFTWYKVVP